MNYKKACIILIPLSILFALSAIVMLLWNTIIPEVINVSSISYWQAMGILILCKILFGGFHCGRKHQKHAHKKRLFNKFKRMSPAEREEFKRCWREKFRSKD